MTVEVAEGKSEGPWKFPEAPEVVMRMEAGAEADDATGIRTGGGGATGAVCVVPVMARCVTRLYSRARERSIQSSTSEIEGGGGGRGGGRGIREGGVQRLRQTAPELDDDRSLVSKLRFLHKCPEAVDVRIHGFSGPLEVFRVLQFDHCSLCFCDRVEFVAESIHERLDGDPDIRSGGCVVSDRAVPPSPGPTRCHEREDPPDLCFRRGGGSGLELEVEAGMRWRRLHRTRGIHRTPEAGLP